MSQRTAATPAPRFTHRDLLHVIRIPVLFTLSWLLPERIWQPVSMLMARLVVELKPAEARRLAAHYTSAYGVVPMPYRMAKQRLTASWYESVLQCFREYRWDGWCAETSMTGQEHIAAALESGKGAILWVQAMPFSDIVSKRALAAAGFPPHHLSRPTHGFSASRFGIRVLNPIWTRIECRYLAERIVLHAGSTVATLRRLRALLHENRIVSITVDDNAVKTIAVPFGRARLRLATGPMTFALSTGAPLLPVFTSRRGGGGFEVTVGSSLNAPDCAKGADAIAALAMAYARRLEAFFASRPDAWVPIGSVYPVDESRRGCANSASDDRPAHN